MGFAGRTASCASLRRNPAIASPAAHGLRPCTRRSVCGTGGRWSVGLAARHTRAIGRVGAASGRLRGAVPPRADHSPDPHRTGRDGLRGLRAPAAHSSPVGPDGATRRTSRCLRIACTCMQAGDLQRRFGACFGLPPSSGTRLCAAMQARTTHGLAVRSRHPITSPDRVTRSRRPVVSCGRALRSGRHSGQDDTLHDRPEGRSDQRRVCPVGGPPRAAGRVSRRLKDLRQQVFRGLLMPPSMAALTKHARKPLIRLGQVRTCAGLAT